MYASELGSVLGMTSIHRRGLGKELVPVIMEAQLAS